MDPNGVVFDLSSDEEVGWSRYVGVGGDDFDWIQKLLDEVDKDSDDSDDVVVVSEVVGKPKPKSKNSNAVVKSLDDDDDDDCVILDGNPDKSVAIQNNPVVDESDELLVVGETGQVACRDFPHARHLCAEFPFTSTPHERHCNQCHCYVCDSLAPCLHWGTGISSSDHCHATEKEESWKHQRKCFRNSHQATISVPIPSCASMSTGLTQINQVPLSTPLVAQGEVPRPASIRACTRATNFGLPNITNQCRSQRSGHVMPGNNFHPNLVLQQLQSTGNNVISRDRRRIVGNLGPQLNSLPAVFKRAGSHRVALTSNPNYISSNKRYEHMRYPYPVSTLGDNNSMRWQQFQNQMSLESNTSQLSSQPNMQTNPLNSVPSQPPASFQPNMHINPLDSVPSQPQLSSQPNVASILLNSVPTHQPMVSQQNIGNFFVNSVTSQPQVPSQAYMGSMFLRSMSSQPQLSSLPTIGNSFANTVPSESQVYSQLNYASNDYPKLFAQENQSHNFLDSGITDIDLSWVTPISQSSQQPTAENSLAQDVDCIEESSSLAGIDTLFGASTDPVSLDFEYDNWTLDHQDVPIPSPGPALTDSGIFFGL